MPKRGFKSITVSEIVYDRFWQIFFDNKDELSMKGINSFSGYVTNSLEQMMRNDDTVARHTPKIEKISVDDDRVILKDNIKNRIVEVQFNKNDLFCIFCDSKDCKHVGFSEGLVEVLEIQGKEQE